MYRWINPAETIYVGGLMHGDDVVKVIFNRPKRFEHTFCSRLEIATLKRRRVLTVTL